MKKFYFLFTSLLLIALISSVDIPKEKSNARVLPFSRIKLKGEDVYICLGLRDEHWHRLLSIDSVGADALVTHSKAHFGVNKCDYDIECFKYNIIANFDKVFASLTNNPIPKRVGLEYASENKEIKVSTGVDVESTEEKFKLNEANLELNVKLSKEVMESIKNIGDLSPFIFKGLNRLKKAVVKMFSDDDKDDTHVKTEINENLRKELKDMN